MNLRGREFEWRFPRPTLVMGIVNVTPDSFSDGGRFLEPRAAIEHGLELVAEGAEILDIGGESSRPGAVPVGEREELARVLPVLAGLRDHKVNAVLSIDTAKPAVARAALEAGAQIVNDVGANRAGPEMWQVVAEAHAGYIAMHMQGTPASMQVNPHYERVVEEIAEFFEERLGRLEEAGVPVDCVALDPGFGFGKKRAHNLKLLAQLSRFKELDRPLVVGVSRKSFLAPDGDKDVGARLPAALAGACWSVQAGAAIVRVHDVRATVRAIRFTEELVATERESDR